MMTDDVAWAEEILAFWFGLEPEQWWRGGDGLDTLVRERFEETWEEQRGRPAESFLGSPREALAAAILFDQFPRNMFRGHADAYATDHLALAVAKGAVDRDMDEGLGEFERNFLYMPFQHSEDLDDQVRSLGLFTALGNDAQLRYAKLHHDVVRRFGRFPHRNAILGRSDRPDEIGACDVRPW